MWGKLYGNEYAKENLNNHLIVLEAYWIATGAGQGVGAAFQKLAEIRTISLNTQPQLNFTATWDQPYQVQEQSGSSIIGMLKNMQSYKNYTAGFNSQKKIQRFRRFIYDA